MNYSTKATPRNFKIKNWRFTMARAKPKKSQLDKLKFEVAQEMGLSLQREKKKKQRKSKKP